ncbi:hypothetical protein PHISP_00093 [Aspergillus sp. HF37]|nr:hypothetical protein PHISP_00093 [Aspergillus sp. HF37]
MAAAIDAPTAGDAAGYRPRNYQLEMLDASIKENIIVAMDTGSGKTHIAILRIIKELERCRPDKLVWFLAPTVDLCMQQHKVISSNIPAVKSRTLTGLDKVDLWTDQIIWDAVLQDVRIVVSPYAVLADALGHGFVNISQIALMVFDEAHHCRKRHPANKIMDNFYRPALSAYGPDAVPHILGLTASPIMKSKPQELDGVESNLNSVCKTPREHRTELLQHTNRPELLPLTFPPPQILGLKCQSQALELLVKACSSVDIENDPYVKTLKKRPFAEEKLQEIILKGQTFYNKQLETFVKRSGHIYGELGSWATDYFILTSIEQFKSSISDSSLMANWDHDVKTYLADFLSQIPLPDIQLDFTTDEHFSISPKLATLINFLDQRYEPGFSGLIFVRQRVAVTIMTHILSIHPLTKDRYRCAAYVGWSGNNNRKEYLGDLHNLKTQRDTIGEFRTGRKNLIISTDVLEEGIDISACSMVVCYDKPPNLKSFVQRRGRARQKKSTYAIMISDDDELAGLDRWRGLEAAMVKAYQDDERQRRQELDLEDDEEEVPGTFRVKSTGALLSPDVAMAHLYHFCAVLPPEPYTDNRPVFTIEDHQEGSRRMTVILPNSVHPEVRCIRGKRGWCTGKAAMKDAAFQAYKSLYEFGLVNDNLLPLASKPDLKFDELPELPSLIDVSEQYDPWVDLAHSWSSPDIHRQQIRVQRNGTLVDELTMALTVPAILPSLDNLTLFWDKDTTFTLSLGAATPVASLAPENVEEMRAITTIFLQAVSPRLVKLQDDFVALFVPDTAEAEMRRWINANKGREPALDVLSMGDSHRPSEMGIVRDCMNYDKPLMFRRWLVSDADSPSTGVELECDPLPRRQNLLSRQTLAEGTDVEASSLASKSCIVPAASCTVDNLPFAQSLFGLFISAIMERLGVTLIATKLCDTVLNGVGLSSTRHVITAITAPSAQAGVDYQRYEFFGDSVLKFTVSCQLFLEHPNWHEGYLSESRDQSVQNARLTRIALDAGLDAYIITNPFTPRKWTAPLISEKAQATPAQRTMSAKILADVVEALIGACYMDGGMAVAQACIKRFLPQVDLQKLDTQSIPRSLEANGHVMNRNLPQHIGYSFNNEALLIEALTHPSCDYDTHTQSYQRLEFLGDAVIDIIVVTALAKHATEIPQGVMTMIKAAVVNANLLAFFCMEFALTEQKKDVQQTPDGEFNIITGEEQFELWRLMRCRDQALKANCDATVERHGNLRSEIADSLLHSDSYPWELLSGMNAEKFFSDLIESIVGAIFVDSNGDLAACEAFIERIGILPYLRRILDHGIDVVHPRNRAQRMAKTQRLIFTPEKNKLDSTIRLVSRLETVR